MELAYQIRKLDPNATIVFVTTHSEFMPLTFRYKVSALDFIDEALGDLHFYERVKSALNIHWKNGSTVAHDSFKFEHHYLVSKFHLIKFFILKHLPTVCIRLLCIQIDERLEFYAGISEIEKRIIGYTDVTSHLS